MRKEIEARRTGDSRDEAHGADPVAEAGREFSEAEIRLARLLGQILYGEWLQLHGKGSGNDGGGRT